MFNGQVTIKIKNYTAYELSAELFNYNSSFLFIKNPNYSLAPYNYCPVGTYEGLNNLIQAYLNPPPPPPAPPFPLGIVTFNASGSAQVFGNYNWPTMLIETDDLCYRSLFESSKSTFFVIDGIRLQVNNNSQLSNPIVFFKQTFLGARIENQINPLAYLDPSQYQSNIVDIPISLEITPESGLYISIKHLPIPIKPGNSANINLTMNIKTESKTM